MKNLYKVISVILIVIMIGISMPSDLFALRPVAHKLTRQLYNGPVSPKNYAILTTPTEGSRQFISENTALVKLEFSLLTIEKIKDFKPIAPGNEKEDNRPQYRKMSFNGDSKSGAAKTNVERINGGRKNENNDGSPYQPPLSEVIKGEVEEVKSGISAQQGLSNIKVSSIGKT